MMNCFRAPRGLCLSAWALLLLIPLPVLAAPEIVLDTLRIEFGRVPQHQVYAREIRIDNRGDEPLLITEVYTSCSCTEVSLRSETVEPGGHTVLDVTFHSRDLSGENNKTVDISSNDPERSFIELPLLAYVAAPIIVTPSDRTLDFGKVARGESPRLEATLTVEERESLALAIESLDASRFEAEILPGDTPRQLRLSLGLKPDAVAGPFRKVLRLSTDDPRLPGIDFELSGTVLGELGAKPSRLNFRFLRPGQEMAKELSVSAASGLEFRVTGGEVDLPGLAVEVLDDGAGGVARLRVSGRALAADDPLATANQGRVKGSLRIFTNRPEEPELQVDLLYMLR
jgi:hypothetical protein